MPEDATSRGRVCIVRHSYYPSELNVKREAETLLRAGYDVTVLCLRGSGEAPREQVGGVDVHRLPVGHERGKLLRYLFEYNAFFVLASLKLVWLHLRARFRFVQVNTMPDYLVFIALVPKILGAKVILHVHEPMPELFKTMYPGRIYAPLIGLITLSEKLGVAFADRVLTVSREMRANLGSRGADVNKITVIVNVPDDEMFRLDRYEAQLARVGEVKREERRRGVFRVVTHGAIEERYGVDVIVRAVASVRDRVPGIEFRLMGKGEYLDDVLVLARTLGLNDRVRYLGFLDFEEMVTELLGADVGIVPMQRNGYSVLVHTNKMYEYMALHRPVIASRLDSVQSYFPDDTIIYFEPGNAEDLADKIYYAFAHPEEVEARVRRATSVYETYRWERERRKYLSVYENLAGETAQLERPTAI